MELIWWWWESISEIEDKNLNNSDIIILYFGWFIVCNDKSEN